MKQAMPSVLQNPLHFNLWHSKAIDSAASLHQSQIAVESTSTKKIKLKQEKPF